MTITPKEIELVGFIAKIGEGVLKSPFEKVHFAANPSVSKPTQDQILADELTADLDNYPHAFVLGCLFDRQIKAEKAWIIPYELKKRIGSFELAKLCSLSLEEWEMYLTSPVSLHRYAKDIAKCAQCAVQKIQEQYSGDASLIWNYPGLHGTPSATEVMVRFWDFDGFGPKLASMATNLLARHFKINFKNLRGLDISVDTHVKRVFLRMGLAPKYAKNEAIVALAREYYPEYPGALDLGLFETGRSHCHASNPNCVSCKFTLLCPKLIDNAI